MPWSTAITTESPLNTATAAGTDDVLPVVKVPGRTRTPLHRWLLVIAVAAGLIGMHHLIADSTHSHDGGHSRGAATFPITDPALSPGGHTVTASGQPALAGPGRPSHADGRTSAAAETATARCCPGTAGMMGHLCLAVLTAAGVLIAAMAILAVVTTPHAPLLSLAHGVDGLLARAPPPTSGVRLAQLGVWRC